MSSTYGIIIEDDTNTRAYFNFTNAGLDATGRFTTITATGTPNQVTGIIGQGFNFDGTSENFDIGSIPVTAYPFTLNAWVNSSGDKPDGGVIAIGDASATNVYFFLGVDNGFPRAAARNGGGQPSATATTDIGTGTWFMITGVFNSATDRRIYVNAVNEANNTDSITFNAAIDQTSVGQNADNQADQFFQGVIDEPSVWNKTLTQDEITQLYNAGAAFGWNFAPAPAPAITFDNVTIDDVVNFNNTFYNVSSVNLEVNLSTTDTNNNTNVTFFLFNSTGSLINTTQFMTNSLNGDLDIVFPSEGTFQFFLNASNNETNTLSPSSGNFTIHFDQTAPSLVVTLPAEFGFYDDFNFSNFINVSDVNLLSCNVTVSDETDTICTNTSYSFVFNGNHTINVTATDLAGNVNTSLNNIMLINPLQTFRFNTSNGSIILNFTFGSRASNNSGFVQFDTFNDSLVIGNNTLLFESLGFASTNVTFVLTNTSELNLTTTIQLSTIILDIFNRETLIRLLGNSTFQLIPPTGGIGENGTTATGTVNITNALFISGQYQLIVSHIDFSTESIFFTYTNQETLSVQVFLLNETAVDAGFVIIKAVADTGQLVQGATCRALQWISTQNAFINVAEGLTDVNGETILNIEISTQLYKFSCTKAGVTVTLDQQIVQSSGVTIPVTMPTQFDIPVPTLINFNGNLTNVTLNATHQQIIFNFIDNQGLVTQGCIEVYTKSGARETLTSQTCVSSSQAEIQIVLDINQTFNQVVKGVVFVDTAVTTIDSILFKALLNIEAALKQYGLDIIVPLMLMLAGIAFGFTIVPQNIFVSMIGAFIGVWIGHLWITTIVSFSVGSFVTMVLLFMMWGVLRRR